MQLGAPVMRHEKIVQVTFFRDNGASLYSIALISTLKVSCHFALSLQTIQKFLEVLKLGNGSFHFLQSIALELKNLESFWLIDKFFGIFFTYAFTYGILRLVFTYKIQFWGTFAFGRFRYRNISIYFHQTTEFKIQSWCLINHIVIIFNMHNVM